MFGFLLAIVNWMAPSRPKMAAMSFDLAMMLRSNEKREIDYTKGIREQSREVGRKKVVSFTIGKLD